MSNWCLLWAICQRILQHDQLSFLLKAFVFIPSKTGLFSEKHFKEVVLPILTHFFLMFLFDTPEYIKNRMIIAGGITFRYPLQTSENLWNIGKKWVNILSLKLTLLHKFWFELHYEIKGIWSILIAVTSGLTYPLKFCMSFLW